MIFNFKLKEEVKALKAENERLKIYIEVKAEEERKELNRQKQMADFWAYNGSPQEVTYD